MSNFLNFLKSRRKHYAVLKHRVLHGFEKDDVGKFDLMIDELDLLIREYQR